MNWYRVFRDGTDNIWELTVMDGRRIKSVTASHREIVKQIDTCGQQGHLTAFSIRVVGEAEAFTERWECNPDFDNRDKTGFRKAIKVGVGMEMYRKYADAIKEMKSDTEDVVELYEMLKEYVNNFERCENAT